MNSPIFAIKNETSVHWELRFQFYGIELNHALEILDQNSKIEVSYTEVSLIFCINFKDLLLTTK